MMRDFVRRALAGVALGALMAACNSPKAPYLLTGDAAAVTAGTRGTDALWMMALPPVTVYARPPAHAGIPEDRVVTPLSDSQRYRANANDSSSRIRPASRSHRT